MSLRQRQRPSKSGTLITGQAPLRDKQKQEAPPQTPFPACLLSCLLMSLSTGRDATGQVNEAHVTAASAQRHRVFHRYALRPRGFLRVLNVS